MVRKFLLKICILGAGDSGKIELINRLMKFSFSEQIKMTIGTDFHLKKFTLVDGTDVTAQLWDLGTQERFKFIIPSFLMGAKGAVFVFNPTRSNAWDEVKEYYSLLKQEIPFVMICNSSDQSADSSWQTQREEYRSFTESRGGIYFEATSKNNLDLEDVIVALAETIVQQEYGLEKYLNLKNEERAVLTALEEVVGKPIPEMSLSRSFEFGYRTERDPDSKRKDIGHISHLALQKLKLNRLPEILGNLTGLEALDLSHNEFEEIPSVIWAFKNLKTLKLDGNPFEGESLDMSKNSIKTIQNYCRTIAAIKVFISYDVDNYNLYQVDKISGFLEENDAIQKAFYAKRDLVGSIKNFMSYTIPQCQVLIFLATIESLNSEACEYEVQIAKKHDIEILPILGSDLNWANLEIYGLNDYFGMKYNFSDFETFMQELYGYIVKMKKEIDLLDKKEDKLQVISSELDVFLRSDASKRIIGDNVEKITEYIQLLNQNKITNKEFISEIMLILLHNGKN